MKDVSLDRATRKRIGAVLYHISSRHHDAIPLDYIFSMLESEGIYPVNEDGTPWSGLLVGREGRGVIDLVTEEGPLRSMLVLSWYKYSTGRYEVNAYLS